jgi:hypothetical protein
MLRLVLLLPSRLAAVLGGGSWIMGDDSVSKGPPLSSTAARRSASLSGRL